MNAFRSIFAQVRGASTSLWLITLLAIVTSSALADERTEYFIRLLQTSSTFKVRAQAALGLGRLEPSRDVLDALSGALRGDDHPAVRAAAATALGKLADVSVKPALERAQRDADADVRTAARTALAELARAGRSQSTVASSSAQRPDPATGARQGSARPRFYVGVGVPSAQQVRLPEPTKNTLRDILVRQLEVIDGVLIAPLEEREPQARAVIEKRKLTGYYIDSSVVSLQRTESGVRAEVSVVLGTYPGRDMKAMLRGGATVPGSGGPDAERRAIEGAFQGAVRRIHQAMEATLASGR
jgi:hypothetical protein